MSTSWVARHGLTSTQYQVEFDKYVKDGYRLIEVDGYSVGGEDRYAAIWDTSSGPAWIARHGMTSQGYQAEFDKHVKDGYRLRLVSGYWVGGQDHYAAIWDKSSGPAWVARHGMDSRTYQAEFNKYVAEGYRLRLVSGYSNGSQDHYAAIWDKSSGPAWIARHGMTSQGYQAEFDKHVQEGYRLRLVSGYWVGSQDHYAAIWDKSSGPAWVARHGMDSGSYQLAFDQYVKDHYRLMWVSGWAVGSAAHYAAIWQKD